MVKTDFFKELNESNKQFTIEENYFNSSELFVLLSIRGMIDTYNSNDFMNSITNFCSLKERKVLVFNVKEISYISSTGIGALIQLNKFCIEESIKIYIMGIQKNVEEIFSLLGFKSYFNYISNLNDIKEENIIRSKFPYKLNCPYCEAILMGVKTGSHKCEQCSSVFRIAEENDTISIIQ